MNDAVEAFKESLDADVVLPVTGETVYQLRQEISRLRGLLCEPPAEQEIDAGARALHAVAVDGPQGDFDLPPYSWDECAARGWDQEFIASATSALVAAFAVRAQRAETS